jgi:predicted Fe-Mo cluster-binding NifX family protein
MKIAVPITQTQEIDNHFGHCQFYQVFSIDDNNTIESTEIIDSPHGCGCKSNIAQELSEKGVKVMLAGGIGEGAINVLNYYGIKVIKGCSGNAKQNVELYLKGILEDKGSACHSHSHECKH